LVPLDWRPASMPLLSCSLLVASLPVSRRSLLAVAGSTGIRPPLQPVSPWLGPAEATLAGSSVFWVRPGSQPSSPSLVKYEPQMALDVLSAAPSRGGALFVGEHHDSASDHVLQAALITSLRQQRGALPLAVGLEAVQRRFQPKLDEYSRGELSLPQLREAVEWDRRWAWPFERYSPVLSAARAAGARLLALNVDSEDLQTVQRGGFQELGRERLARYIPDAAGFADFSTTQLFRSYVDHAVRPSYKVHRQLGFLPAETSFTHYLSTRLLWDEAMGAATAAWVRDNPGGLAISLVGSGHASFGCGAPARCGRALGGAEHIRTVLLNPTTRDTERQELRM